MEPKSAATTALPIHPEGFPFDPGLDRLCRIAAWLGAAGPQNAPVTFLSLLGAFLLGEDETSRWFRQAARQDGFEKELLKAAGITGEKTREFVLENANSGELPPPATDGAFYSVSAGKVLQAATQFFLPGEPPRLTPRRVMASYLLTDHPGHESELSGIFASSLPGLPARFIFKNPAEIAPETTPAARNIILRALALPAADQGAAFLYAAFEAGGPAGGAEAPAVFRALLQALRTSTPVRLEELFKQHLSGPLEKGRLAVSAGEADRSAAHRLHWALEYSAAYFDSAGRIDENGLVASLLMNAPVALEVLLRQFNTGLPEFHRRFAAQIAKESPESAGLWRLLLKGQPPPNSSTPVSGYNADDPYAKDIVDALNVTREAHAFARIAAAAQVRPPLAIGVFGEWGSGKTFFMHLMERHILALTEQAGRTKDAAAFPFHKNIVQIRFNAWHYMETNLWASLVDHIFRELDRWLTAGNQQGGAEQSNKLFEQLTTARELKLDSARAVLEAARSRQTAEKALDDARSKEASARARHERLAPEGIARAALAAVKLRLEAQPEKREQIIEAARQLGFTQLAGSADDALAAIQAVHEQAREGRLLLNALIARIGAWKTAAALAFVFVALPLGALAWAQLAQSPLVEFIRGITGSASYYLVALAGAGAQITTAAARTLRPLRELNDSILAEQSRLKQQVSTEQSAQAAQELDEAQRAVERAAQEFAEASRRVQEAQHEVIGVSARSRLRDFIRDKARGGEYTKHLGIIATIRRDFEQLAQLMAGAGQDGAASESAARLLDQYRSEVRRLIEESEQDGVSLLPAQVREELESSLKAPEKEPATFERIVLYIDDLDRCPPDKVVSVLQAVHLLLFFRLFVVVVAVDARWVSRALQNEYPELVEEDVMLRASGLSAQAFQPARRAGATSQDYLEKIFQIPYWVRPMEAAAAKTHLRNLMKGDQEEERPPAPAAPAIQTNIEVPVTPPAQAEGEQDSMASPSAAPQEPSASTGRQPEPETAQAIAQSLTLTTHEKAILEAMAAFTGGSPRRGVRFVNSYRLVKASLSPADRELLTGEDGKGLAYRALITQLAITTGAPHVAQEYFNSLGGQQSIDDLLNAVAALPALRAIPAEAANLHGAIEKLRDLNLAAGLDAGEHMVEELVRSAPTARRYSFTARPH